MDWFERITGFRERDYRSTQQSLVVRGDELVSTVSGRHFHMGTFSTPSLAELRVRLAASLSPPGRLRVGIVQGDARHLHSRPEFAGALFQVASQFNMLEMVSPSVVPEDGVTDYQFDQTQGPACAMAAGAATIYRNYFVPVGEQVGQSKHSQIDGLKDLGVHLEQATGLDQASLWSMENGYAMCTQQGLTAIARHLESLPDSDYTALMGLLRIGIHADVEVTDSEHSPGPRVTQAFCSALPIAYGEHDPELWQSIAQLVLRAAYEATLMSAVLNESRGGSNTVLLTLIGGGAFGNEEDWILDAIRWALHRFQNTDLNVLLVSYGSPTTGMQKLVDEWV